MSREIEFRGLNENGDFVYGLYVQNAFDGTSRNVAHGIQRAGCYPVEIDPETVGQYAGIKDNDGIKIFEDDICDLWYAPRAVAKCVVEFKDGRFIILASKAKPEKMNLFDVKKHGNFLTVIGNIHQNPERLKVNPCEK